MSKRLVIITGPTAVGKTELSIDLAKHFETEIISADSRQFYKELKIGASPPTKEELSTTKHHFIQHLSVIDDYNVGLFEKDAIRTINNLFMKYNTLIMVGGSGLYIDVITNGLDYFPETEEKTRNYIIKNYKNKGISFLQTQLKEKDPDYYEIVDINNPQRLIRALTIIVSSKLPFSSFQTGKRKKRGFKITNFFLNMNRERLYERINLRVDKMIENGLLNEVKNLIPNRNNNALQTVGYKELFEYFDGDISLNKAIENIKRNTRRFAKRQISWFKGYKEIQHISTENSLKKIIGEL